MVTAMGFENTTGNKLPRVASLSGLKTRSFPASREVFMNQRRVVLAPKKIPGRDTRGKFTITISQNVYQRRAFMTPLHEAGVGLSFIVTTSDVV